MWKQAIEDAAAKTLRNKHEITSFSRFGPGDDCGMGCKFGQLRFKFRRTVQNRDRFVLGFILRRCHGYP